MDRMVGSPGNRATIGARQNFAFLPHRVPRPKKNSHAQSRTTDDLLGPQARRHVHAAPRVSARQPRLETPSEFSAHTIF